MVMVEMEGGWRGGEGRQRGGWVEGKVEGGDGGGGWVEGMVGKGGGRWWGRDGGGREDGEKIK